MLSRRAVFLQTHSLPRLLHPPPNTHLVLANAESVSIRPRMHSVIEMFLFCMMSSWRSELKNPSSANLVAEYEVVKGVGILPGKEKERMENAREVAVRRMVPLRGNLGKERGFAIPHQLMFCSGEFPSISSHMQALRKLHHFL